MWALLPSSRRFVSLLSIGGKYCGRFSHFNFANPIAPGLVSQIVFLPVSYTLARLSHRDERPLLVSPLLGRLILETVIAMRSS